MLSANLIPTLAPPTTAALAAALPDLSAAAPYALLFLPTLIVPAAFLLPLFWRRHGLVLSVHVTPEFLASPTCRRLIRLYVTAIALIAAASIAVTLLAIARASNALLIAGPLLELAALFLLWSWMWRALLPHRLHIPVTRTASLAPDSAADLALGLGPAWWISTLAALLPLAAAAFILASHWSQIPATFPIHWGADGVPNRFASRTPIGVYWPLALAAFLILWMAVLAPFTARFSPSTASRPALFRMTRNILRAVAWLIALIFAATSLLPLVHNPTRYLPAGFAALILTFFAFLIYIVVQAYRHPELARAVDVTDPARWKAGLFYFNPSDAALLVPKRSGLGYTFNMARPVAWVFIAAILAVAFLPLLFIHHH
jgi:uncharacterized membrane protein